MIAVKVSAVEFLLLAGIYVSSMSSCLGAMYGTPRVLQSIANESVIPGIGKLGMGVSIFMRKLKNVSSMNMFRFFREDQIKYPSMQWVLLPL